MRLAVSFLLALHLLAQSASPDPLDALAAEAESYGLRVGSPITSEFKNARRLLRLLVEAVSKGATPALDVDRTRLEAIVRWLRVNGESVKDVSASPFDRMPFFGRATVKGNVLYLHVFAWPSSNQLKVPGLAAEIVSAQLLATGSPLRWSRSGDTTFVDLPDKPPDEVASVIKLSLKSPPLVQPYFIEPDEKGVITAGVESCEIEARSGKMAFKENSPGHVFLANWKRAVDVPTWKVRMPRAGRYSVEMRYAAGPSSAGVVYTVTMRGQTVGMTKGIVESTGNLYKTLPAGDMQLDAGNYMLLIQPENTAGQTAMSLERVILKRIGE